MPRPRLTNAAAQVTGADLKDPKRHAGRIDPQTGPLGPPPAKLAPDHKAAWIEIAGELPWLCQSDRHLVELASLLQVRIRQPDCPMGVFTQLRLCLSSMGATPVDRSRVHWGDEEYADPADEFLN